MAQTEYWMKTDLNQNVSVRSVKGNFFSQDNNGNIVGVVVVKGGAPVTLTGSVYGYIIRPDGATVVVEGSASENRASIQIPSQALAYTGRIDIVIQLASSSVRTVLGACTGTVVQSRTDQTVDPGEIIPDLSELLAKIADCEAATTAANTAASNANTKAGLADTAATNANTKAALADEKATLANTKAGLADAAATNANTKAALADEKATLANTKAGLADTAATTANTAAGAANTAAGNANDKATEAGRVDIAMSKSGSTITIVTTNRNNQQTTETLTEPGTYWKLQVDIIPDTTQTITYDSSGNVSAIVHTDENDDTVRTDAFTFGEDTITETRTLDTGEVLTIVTNTSTLVTTITYTEAA